MSETPRFDSAAPVGFVGLGSMGGGMVRCLLRKGWQVRVFARRPEAAQALVEAGAVAVGSIAALGRECRLVILSLPDATAVEEVLFGADSLADAMAPGSCVVDTSTIGATSVQAFGARLRERAVSLLDAPVSGGQQGAEAGTLGCMVGGDAASVDACRPALESFCKAITHVGALGAGQTVKACNQVAVAGALMGVADALALARLQGVDPAVMRDVLLGGSARTFSLEKHAPRIIDGDFAPGFRARLMRKDLRLALDTARAGDAVLPATVLAEQLLNDLCETGRGDWDWCALALRVQELSGLSVAPAPESGRAPPDAG
jgi:2-hydroxy-3-oxopropionate reductase